MVLIKIFCNFEIEKLGALKVIRKNFTRKTF